MGIPCRSVTNFVSAHDSDKNCVIDRVLDLDGDVNENSSEGVW